MLPQRLLCPRGPDLVDVVVGILNGMPGGDQGRRCLFPDGRDARDVVGLIPHQGLYVDKLIGSHLVVPDNIVRIIVVDRGLPLRRLRDPDTDMGVRKLKKVPVAGDDRDFQVLALITLRDGAEDIVRLEPLHGKGRDCHGIQDLPDQRDLLPQFVGHRTPVALVLRVFFMPEGGRVQVESHRKVICLLFVQDLEHDIQEAVDSVGVESGGIGQRRSSVESAEQNAVAVDQDQL